MWIDTVLEKATTKYAAKVANKEPLIVRDEKTLSGRVHVGSLRGVAIHGAIAEALSAQGIANRYLYEINDFDPMDGLPVYLDKAVFNEHMGKSLCDVPSPDGKAKNFAEYFATEFISVITELGYKPEFYRSSEEYRKGTYNKAIKMALDKADLIREIYLKVSGSERAKNWLPISVRCEKCGKIGTTKATSWNGTTVGYSCGDFVEWAKGCGHAGEISPFGGNAKLPWKVEWAAKFLVFGVNIEGAGKDHSTKGGARDVSDTIARQVFECDIPVNVPYEFFNVAGKKMSSSKGGAISSREMGDLLPPQLLRFLMLYKDPTRVIDFIPDGDTIPVLFDAYDTYAKKYFSGQKDDYLKIFELSHPESLKARLGAHVLPRFSLLAYLVQMPHLDSAVEIEKLDNVKLGELDIVELREREEYAKRWLKLYAPEDFRFEIQETLPPAVREFSTEQKVAIKEILAYVEAHATLDGQDLHTMLHGLKESLKISPQKLFQAIYISVLGRESGPKAGWFLSVLPRDFLIKRLREVGA